MAVTFVPCESLEQALELQAAGLLYMDESVDRPRTETTAERSVCSDYRAAYLRGFSSMDELEITTGWLRTDFCYAVED